MNAIANPADSSHIRRDGGRAGVARCQLLTDGIRLPASSVGDPRATPSSGARHGYRDAHAAPLHTTIGCRLAVAGGDRIMLLSGVPARARYVRRRLVARCCRHKVAPPMQSLSNPTAPRPRAKWPIPHEPITATDSQPPMS